MQVSFSPISCPTNSSPIRSSKFLFPSPGSTRTLLYTWVHLPIPEPEKLFSGVRGECDAHLPSQGAESLTGCCPTLGVFVQFCSGSWKDSKSETSPFIPAFLFDPHTEIILGSKFFSFNTLMLCSYIQYCCWDINVNLIFIILSTFSAVSFP